MGDKFEAANTHPGGEPENHPISNLKRWPLDTPGGRFYAEWDSDAPVTREGQLIFFFQFLNEGGRWERLMENTPLRYTGNRGSGALAVFGTLLLSILNGHYRYAHINTIRGDGVNPELLGMKGSVSEDTVRRALKRVDKKEGVEWLEGHLRDSIAPALVLPWILDIDTTVKPIYGNQEGALIGYNPQKPGRPSHSYHSYIIANLRLVLGVGVSPGNESSSGKGLPGMWRILDRLPREQWPTYIRGDCGYGNEQAMLECEGRGVPFLFKLRQTAKVKNLVRTCFRQSHGWVDTGDGWQAMEAEIRLSGWSKTRRVIVVRETPARSPGGSRRSKDRLEPLLPGDEWEIQAVPWAGKIAVLVSSLDLRSYPTACMPRQYRDRADCENNFDELKNQWGWGGYTTQAIGPSTLAANFIALVYNWWNLYTRFYDAEHHREAVTTRPFLMQGVGRQVQSGGQKTVRISLTHNQGGAVATAVTLVSKRLHEFGAIAEQWGIDQRWAYLLTCVLRPWLGGKWLSGVPPNCRIYLSG